MVLSIILLFFLYRLALARQAPRIKGVEWHKINDAILIAYKDPEDCGCMDSLGMILAEASRFNKAVVILGEAKTIDKLKKHYSHRNDLLFASCPNSSLPPAINRNRTSAVEVRYGFITSKIE